QGLSRHLEAETLVAKIYQLINIMDKGKFSIYQTEKKKFNKEFVAKLYIS
ncbi:hypothetical protein ASPFODRAFT_140216, partial [Aspergillus luchuensis CBS 106.47]